MIDIDTITVFIFRLFVLFLPLLLALMGYSVERYNSFNLLFIFTEQLFLLYASNNHN